jgi:hypothetical protein
MKHYYLGLCAVLALLLTGCGPKIVTVSGNVTLDGTPVAKGVIDFTSLGAEQPPVTADIVNGKYSAKLQTGNKQVRISAMVVTGQKPEYVGGPMMDVSEESIPKRYNESTELTLDVQGSMTKDWPLEKPLR